jgi:hypothetical protein
MNHSQAMAGEQAFQQYHKPNPCSAFFADLGLFFGVAGELKLLIY